MMPSWSALGRTGWLPPLPWRRPAFLCLCWKPTQNLEAERARQSLLCPATGTMSARQSTPWGRHRPFSVLFHWNPTGWSGCTPQLRLLIPWMGGEAVLLENSIEATVVRLGPDAEAYRRLIAPLAEKLDILTEDLLGPMPLPPKHLAAVISFGIRAIQPARGFAQRHFKGEAAQALFAGMAAHAIMPLEDPITASFGLIMLMMGHRGGWPLARGGSQSISKAMVEYLRSLGGEVVTGQMVTSLDELPKARAVLLDTSPQGLLRIAGGRLPGGYRKQLERYRYGPAVCKVDYALDGPIPWAESGLRPCSNRAPGRHTG